MRCSKVLKLLDDHVHGLLPAERAAAVRTHLDACAGCDEEAEILRTATAPLTAWGDLEPPPGCFDAILARIEALPPELRVPAPAARPRLRVLQGGARRLLTAGAVAAAVLVTAGFLELDGAGTAAAPVGANVLAKSRPAASESGASLKSGEVAAFRVTGDYQQRDRLLRRRATRTPSPFDTPAPAVPVSFDGLGVQAR